MRRQTGLAIRRSKIEDRWLKIAVCVALRSSILDPRSSILRVLALIFAFVTFSPCAFAQIRTTSRQVSEAQGSRADQLPLSGRSGQAGSVTATQTPTPGATTSVNTINP